MNDKEIIGATDIQLISSYVTGGVRKMKDNDLIVSKFDTTTYVDRAIIQLHNDSAGYSAQNDFSLRGKLVTQSANRSGFLWEYSDYDDIEKRGEITLDLSNKYIMNAVQVESIGDFLQKELKPHPMYTLMLSGCHSYMEIGDKYTLNISYLTPQSVSEIELINVDVEIQSISIERSVGGIGSTSLVVRVPSDAWSKTTSRRARLIAAGQPQLLLNRSNFVIVASNEFTGQADYYCDGTDDQVQIQAAINYVGSIGGGQVILTNGTFNINNQINSTYCLKIEYDNITLIGSGQNSCIIQYTAPDNTTNLIVYIVSEYCSIEKIKFISIGTYKDFITHIYAYNQVKIKNIKINNCSFIDGIKLINLEYTVQVMIESCYFYSEVASQNNDIYYLNIYLCENILINNNIIELSSHDSFTDKIYPIYITSAINASIAFNKIFLDGSSTADLWIILMNGGENIINSNNIIINGASHTGNLNCIYIQENTNTTVISNIIKCENLDFNGVITGINIIDSDNCIVSNNNISGIINDDITDDGYGLYINSGSDRTNVSGNILLNNESNYINFGTNTTSTGNITS